MHHGNGTAFIFESDPRVFTLSMHQQHNYPMWKPRGSLDIGLADGTRDATYLRELARGLGAVAAHLPRCVFYLAGADSFYHEEGNDLFWKPGGNSAGDGFPVELSPRGRLTVAMQALFAAHPHLQRLDAIAAGNAADIGKLAGLGGTPDRAPLRSVVEDFYFTNPIARASAVMAECSAIAEGAAALTAAE